MQTIEERLEFLNLKVQEHDKAFTLNQASLPSINFQISPQSVSINRVEVQNRFVRTSTQNRFVRLITTRKGSRVMLPEFGSKLNELIDKNIDEEYKLKFRHYIADAFYNSKTSKPWDSELIPDTIKVQNITDDGTLEVTVKMKNGEVYKYGQ